ncbi:hypothetical protein [Xylocopilactobacillus apis]|uniref:Phage protein n=1 Tax=Xylocopilactobacillus apis TaxID=2932183 RepID=A0AAU9D1U9_9LACO|nr:hypothetical protein [Xylocopilactobacillus apis]BDR57459.1 hypothetical protein KIMC2_20210 [Xylocopilactobacillus apis]BDR57508.1 hypothetical protein KIMC2_20700 [Xylocopilactobacillus apis]
MIQIVLRKTNGTDQKIEIPQLRVKDLLTEEKKTLKIPLETIRKVTDYSECLEIITETEVLIKGPYDAISDAAPKHIIAEVLAKMQINYLLYNYESNETAIFKIIDDASRKGKNNN